MRNSEKTVFKERERKGKRRQACAGSDAWREEDGRDDEEGKASSRD